MNRVRISAEEVPLPSWTRAVNAYILKILKYLGRDHWDLSVLFCDNGYIRELNARYRDRDEPTDILSFRLGAGADGGGSKKSWYLPGDIVISLETLAENARYFKVSEDEELRRLLVHGILHLDGMDHDANDEGQPMLRLQEAIVAEFAGERILPLKAGAEAGS
ncbi:MAG: rRNA maturation RNase YbeY [Treponema sp.]|jgi:probable rRNA maturation factor|nr:rRNA maturation RNase YbeY [Treponema sp.]